jgi:hypothetical protein
MIRYATFALTFTLITHIALWSPSVSADDVLYELSVDSTNHTYDVYATLLHPSSPPSSVGIASLIVDVVGTGGLEVTASQLQLPWGPTAESEDVGFSLLRDGGLAGIGIRASQAIIYPPASTENANDPAADALVLQGIGTSAGSLTLMDGSTLAWQNPVHVASGTFTGDFGSLHVRSGAGTTVLLKNVAAIDQPATWSGPGNAIGAGEILGMEYCVSDQAHPCLPGTDSPPWQFEGVNGDGQWFDPTPASGYLYETDGASNFLQVGLPLGLEPAGDGQYQIISALGSATVAEGTFYSFPSPVTSFSILEIDPPVDGDDPLAFPVFLQFDASRVSFTITPIPEPNALLLIGLGLLVVGRRNRANRP